MEEMVSLKILEPSSLEKDSYTSLCFEAMMNLTNQWYMVTDDDNEDAPVLERNYVLSLVFQMGKNANSTTEFGTNVFPSGENNKDIYLKLEEIKTTYNDLYGKEFKPPFEVIPDLVIHTSHNPQSSNSNSQHVVIEAKTTKNLGKVAFMRDLFKLNVYLTRLNYKNAIYLLVNTTKKRIEYLIKQYFDNPYYKANGKLNQLLFFIQECEGQPPCAYKLCEEYLKSIEAYNDSNI